jgi:NADH-quinone oxidoreductase subunit E
MARTKKQTPEKFEFSAESIKLAEYEIAKYPAGKQFSAVKALLDIAQRQNGGWLSRECIEAVGDYLNMPYIRVQENATFYEQFHTEKVGENVVWVCRTTPCWLRGSDDILDACKKHMNIDVGETTSDGKFTLKEMECLGACVNAPILWVNDDFYEDVDAAGTTKILKELKAGKRPAPGSIKGRQCSAPEGFKPKEAKESK